MNLDMRPAFLFSEDDDALLLNNDGEQQTMTIEEHETLAYYYADEEEEDDDDDGEVDDGGDDHVAKNIQQLLRQHSNGGGAGDTDKMEEEADCDTGSCLDDMEYDVDQDALADAFEDYWYNDPKEITLPNSLVDSQRLGGTLQIALGSESDWDGLIQQVLLLCYDYYRGAGSYRARGGELYVELYCHPEKFGCPNWTCAKAKQFIRTLASIQPREFNLRYTRGFPISLLKEFLEECGSTLEHLTVDPGVVFINDDDDDDDDNDNVKTPVGMEDSKRTLTQQDEAAEVELRNSPITSAGKEHISFATHLNSTDDAGGVSTGGDDGQQQRQTATSVVQLLPIHASISISVVRRGRGIYDDEIRDYDYISGMTAFLRLPMFSDGSACHIEIDGIYYDHVENDDDDDEDERTAGKEILDCIGRLRAKVIILTNIFCGGDRTTTEQETRHYISVMCQLVGRTEIFDIDCMGYKAAGQQPQQPSFPQNLLLAMANAVKDNTTLKELNIWYKSEESSLPSTLTTALEQCMECNCVLESLDIYNAGIRNKVTLSERTKLFLFLNKGGKRRFKKTPTTIIDTSSSAHAVAVVPPGGALIRRRTYQHHDTQEWIKAIMNCNSDDFLESRYPNDNNHQEKENDLLKLSGILYFLRDKPELLLGACPSTTTSAATRIDNKATPVSLQENTLTVKRYQKGTTKRKSSDNASNDSLLHHGTEEIGREAKLPRLSNQNTKAE